MSSFRTAAIRYVPWQKDIYGFTFLQVWRLCENISEILVWLQTIFLRRFDDAENCRTCFGTRRGIGEEPILSADDKRLDASLGAVVVDLQPAVLDVTAQVRFFLDQIIDRLAELALWRDVSE